MRRRVASRNVVCCRPYSYHVGSNVQLKNRSAVLVERSLGFRLHAFPGFWGIAGGRLKTRIHGKIFQCFAICLAILATQRHVGVAAGDEYHRIAARIEAATPATKENDSHASRKDRTRDGAGNDVLLRSEKRLNYAVHGLAAGNAAGDLRND